MEKSVQQVGFDRLFRGLWPAKWHGGLVALGFYLIVIILRLAKQVIHGGFGRVDLFTAASGDYGIGLIFLIWLIVRTERQYVSPGLQLVPATAAEQYLAGLSTTLVAYLGFVGIRSLVLGLGLLLEGPQALARVQRLEQHATSVSWPVMLGLIVLMIVGFIVAVVVAVSLIHFTINSLSAFFPAARQGLVKVLMGIVVAVTLIAGVTWLEWLQYRLLQGIANWALLGFGVVTLGLLIVVMIMVNIWLMHRWVETR